MTAAGAGPACPEGTKLGRFELIEEIGRGVMAVVYKAHDPVLQRLVAVKAIEPSVVMGEEQRAAYEERFLNEARIAGRLTHPGIVVVHDTGSDPATGRLFIALEYLEGRTLEELTASGGALPWHEAARIVVSVARALHYAHEQGVIHRDVKPANIMLLPSGHQKVMDFGIAKLATASYQTSGTARLLGTPLYLSPEQAQGEAGDRRTDVFSLGAVAYRLLTGRHAFAAESISKVLERVMRDDPPTPSSIEPSVPPEIDRIVARALAKAASDRYADARCMAEDLRAILARRLGRPNDDDPTLPPGAPTDTLASPPAAAVTPIDATWFPEERTTVRRRAGARAAAGLAVLGGVILLHLLRRDSDAPAFAPLPSAPKAGAPTSPPPPLLPEGPPRPRRGAPAPAATPQDTTPPATIAPANAATTAEGQARVTVLFRHGLRSGRLLISVDGEPVLDQPTYGRASTKFLSKSYRGTVNEAILVPAGKHQLRVRVRWDKQEEAATIVGNFAPGSERRLRVSLEGGLLGKDLVLDWY